MGQEFEEFFAERGEVSLSEINEKFVALKKCNVNFLVGRCSKVIRTGDGLFIHASLLNLQDEDFDPIKKFLHQNCSTPISSRVLFDLFF